MQIGPLIFWVDFIILHFELDLEVPYILGHPFLATGRAYIDVAEGKLKHQAQDKVELFEVYKLQEQTVIFEEVVV